MTERLCHRLDGAPFWNDRIVMPDHAPTESDALFLDVTTRPTAGYAAGASAAENRLPINLIPAGVVVHRFPGEFTYATAKATRLPGVPYDTAIGALITDPRWQFIREDGSVLPIEECPVSRAVSTRALVGNIVRNIVLGFTRDGDQPSVCRRAPHHPRFIGAIRVTLLFLRTADCTNIARIVASHPTVPWAITRCFFSCCWKEKT